MKKHLNIDIRINVDAAKVVLAVGAVAITLVAMFTGIPVPVPFLHLTF